MRFLVPVITVDGPSGVGKSTLCKLLAEIFHLNVLDSGAIYRVLALEALRKKMITDDEEALAALSICLDILFLIKQGRMHVLLEGQDVSQIIRNEKIGNAASKIATFSRVRQAILRRQRTFRTSPGLIADGRDMGTVVFPDATIKIFLYASLEKRAYRRMRQLQEKGFSVSFRRLLSEIKERDDRDRTRIVAPLVPAPDALVLDSTDLSIDEVVVKVIKACKADSNAINIIGNTRLFCSGDKLQNMIKITPSNIMLDGISLKT